MDLDYPADAEAFEIDLHLLLVALVRLRRCIDRAARGIPEMESALKSHLRFFHQEVRGLEKLRNVSEHIDEYNVDEGRDSSVSRRQVQNWYIDSSSSGGAIWGWLGERLDVDAADQAAGRLYSGFIEEYRGWINAQRLGAESERSE